MESYKKSINILRRLFISLVFFSVLYLGVFVFFIVKKDKFVSEILLDLSPYIGSIIGSILGITGALYAVFITLNAEKIQKVKEETAKKLRIIKRMKELTNRFMLYSFNEGVDLEDKSIEKALYIYKEAYNSFYNEFMDMAIEIDVDYYNKCDEIFVEVNYVIMLLENSSEEDGQLKKVKIPISILSNLKIFNSDQAKKIIELSNEKAKEIGGSSFDEKGYYDLYKIGFTLNSVINSKLRELSKVTNEHEKELKNK